MKRIYLIVAISIVAFPATGSSAQDVDSGNELLSQCQSFLALLADTTADVSSLSGEAFEQGMDSGTCLGRVGGVSGVSMILESHMAMCIPDGVTQGQLVRVVVQFLEEYPTILGQDAAVLVVLALRQAFPCG